MENILAEIGIRIKFIRTIFADGSKLSAEQFAFILDETGDKIRNFELGRAAVPVRLLHSLYYRGFSADFIISGEGSILADNEEGVRFGKILEKKNIDINAKYKEFFAHNYVDNSTNRVAAGKIKG